MAAEVGSDFGYLVTDRVVGVVQRQRWPNRDDVPLASLRAKLVTLRSPEDVGTAGGRIIQHQLEAFSPSQLEERMRAKSSGPIPNRSPASVVHHCPRSARHWARRSGSSLPPNGPVMMSGLTQCPQCDGASGLSHNRSCPQLLQNVSCTLDSGTVTTVASVIPAMGARFVMVPPVISVGKKRAFVRGCQDSIPRLGSNCP